jgi:hypothetical protein
MSSPRIKKPGLVSKSYRMSRAGLGCKMAGGFITTATGYFSEKEKKGSCL